MLWPKHRNVKLVEENVSHNKQYNANIVGDTLLH